MRPIAPRLILVAITALTMLAATVLVRDAVATHLREEMSEDFQSLVHGLGFGPALDLSQGTHRYDPRLYGELTDVDAPLPGGERYDARDPFSIFPSAPLRRRSFVTTTEE
jgi:hypothetical protein